MPYGRSRTPRGQYRNRVTVYARPTVDDGMGGQTASAPAASAVTRMWVKPEPLDDRRAEAIMAGQVTAQSTYHFSTPYRTNLLKTMYFDWRGRQLEIQSIADDTAMKDRLVIFCSEVSVLGS